MSKEVSHKLGAFLMVQRKARGLSVRKVSSDTGIHPGAIAKFERGKTDMTTSKMLQLVQCYGCLADFETFLRVNLI